MEFKGRRLISLLYEAFRNIWKDKRVIKAIIAGVTIYGTPAAYRYVTRNPILPYVPLQIHTFRATFQRSWSLMRLLQEA